MKRDDDTHRRPRVLFFALAIGGLFYVRWSPYYAKVFVAARDHTLGASIVSGNLPAAPDVSWQGGLAYSIAYLKAIWQALLLGLVLGAGIEALLPRMTLGRLFTGSMGSIRAGAFSIPSMMCTCCSAPIAVGMLESGAGPTSTLVYWLANPVLNPAALVFIGFVLGWQWRRSDWRSVWRSCLSSPIWLRVSFRLIGVQRGR